MVIWCLYYYVSFLYLVAAFSPTDHYLINCGSSLAETLDSYGRVFVGDDSAFLAPTSSFQLESSDPPAAYSPLYHTARAFNRPAHYVFPITDSGVHHLVRLHFYPLGEAEFHVVTSGFLLLFNFSLPVSRESPIVKEFVIPVAYTELNITFVPSENSKFAFVNAIEVLSAPQDLFGDVVVLVNDLSFHHGMLRNGFETLHRVNVGGSKLTPLNDTLWRTWVTDDDAYLLSSLGSEMIHFEGTINYQIGKVSREVGPENVYNTARVIRSLDDSIPQVNMTWSFEVDMGYDYMVRMHFCDIVSVSAHMLYFNLYINGKLVYENLDLSSITNLSLASPSYADFVVIGESLGKVDVSVGPSTFSLPRAVDAILNGIEIWKLNNSMGGFNGDVWADFVLRKWGKEHASVTNVLLPVMGAIFLLLCVLLLCASVFLQRKRKNVSVGWSRFHGGVTELSYMK